MFLDAACNRATTAPNYMFAFGRMCFTLALALVLGGNDLLNAAKWR